MVVPVVLLCVAPLCMEPLDMPGLFTLSPWGAGPVDDWARAEPHISVSAAPVKIILRIVISIFP